jgi:ABC-type oligopeptide transport system substrate-binding subunit
MTDRSSSVSAYARRLAAMLVLALAAAAFLAGCGSSSSTSAASSSSTTAAASSTPAYCSDVNNFKSAVAQLKDTGSPAAIVASITKVATSGQLAISAVKTAFASQVGALKSSLTALTNTATQLTSSSTRASALHQVPGEVTAVKAAAGKFVDATKCG